MSRIPFCVVVLVAVLSLFGCREVQSALDLQPSRVYLVPDTTKEEYLKMYDALDQGLAELPIEVAESPIYRHFYSPSCSWYCSGEVEKVWASSNLKNDRYGHCYAENIHDFDHESSWGEGVPGDGVGEFVVFEFPRNCPRITGVNILNGNFRSEELWRKNGRVKKFKLYHNDKPYAMLNLEDSRSLQTFEIDTVGYDPKKGGETWSLKFEIVEVYPGSQTQNTMISEIYFDGIDVH